MDLLARVLEAHRQAGVVIKAKKTFLFQEHVEFLGFEISGKGVGMTQKFRTKALEWPEPKTPKELSTALGFFSYYASFIPQFAALTANLNAHKNGKSLDWTPELARDFATLKRAFENQVTKHHLVLDKNGNAPGLEVSIDFSSQAVAAVISQNVKGQQRFITAAGRKLKGYESRYHSSKGGLLAL